MIRQFELQQMIWLTSSVTAHLPWDDMTLIVLILINYPCLASARLRYCTSGYQNDCTTRERLSALRTTVISRYLLVPVGIGMARVGSTEEKTELIIISSAPQAASNGLLSTS